MSARDEIHWGYLLAGYASLFVLGMTDNARPSLFDDVLQELTLSDGAGSLMFAATSAGLIAGSLGFRRLVRRSAVRGLHASLILAAVGLVLTGQAPGLPLLIAGSAIFGVALGGLALVQNLMVEQAAPLHLRRRLLSGLHSIYGLSSLLAPLAVVGLGGLGLSWRWIFALLALPALALLVGTLRVESRPPPEGEPTRPPLGVTALVSLMAALYCTAELVISTRLPLLLEREGHPEALADGGLSVFFLCLLVSRLGYGLIPVPLSNRTMIAICLTGSLALAAVGVWVEPLVLPFTALTLGPFFPTAVDLLAEEVKDGLEGALGILFAVISLFVASAHVGVGLLSDAIGLRRALAVCPLALGLGLIVLAILSRSDRRGSRARSSACEAPPRSDG